MKPTFLQLAYGLPADKDSHLIVVPERIFYESLSELVKVEGEQIKFDVKPLERC